MSSTDPSQGSGLLLPQTGRVASSRAGIQKEECPDRKATSKRLPHPQTGSIPHRLRARPGSPTLHTKTVLQEAHTCTAAHRQTTRQSGTQTPHTPVTTHSWGLAHPHSTLRDPLPLSNLTLSRPSTKTHHTKPPTRLPLAALPRSLPTDPRPTEPHEGTLTLKRGVSTQVLLLPAIAPSIPPAGAPVHRPLLPWLAHSVHARHQGRSPPIPLPL